MSEMFTLVPSLICRICSDKARGLNFDVLTCTSCKAFFRRNALIEKSYRCAKKYQCTITKSTRAQCSACRLRKCYASGMNPRLFRTLPEHLIKSGVLEECINKKHRQLKIHPSLIHNLQNDCSILTTDQWTLLSNVIHSYDQFNQINRIKRLFLEKSSLLPKLRTKPRHTLNIFNEIIIGIQPLMERSSHFQCLSKVLRRYLIFHNMAITGGVNAIFISRETNILEDVSYHTICTLIYGTDLINESKKIKNRIEQNGNLIKLFLFVLIFSSNCTILSYNQFKYSYIQTNSIELFHIQNIYSDILWKYMIYLYGYQQAAIRFAYLLTNTLCIFSMAKRVSDDSAHNMLVDRVVKHIESELSKTN